jgi:hypothetical protein
MVSRFYSPWSLVSIISGPVVRQNIMIGSMWWSKAAHLMMRKKERERERRERERISPNTHFF